MIVRPLHLLVRGFAAAVLLCGTLFLGACGREDSAPQPAPAVEKKAIPPAPKPAGPLAKGAACVTPECHAAFASARAIHQPVAIGSCDACHDADTGTHKYPLKRAGNDTCTFCHTVSGVKEHQHKALTQQGCLACHNPHASRAKFLLVADNVEAVCIKCHTVPMKKFAHAPFAAGQCTVCHLPHQADNAMLLRGGAGPDHCLSCHTETKKTLATAAHVHVPSKQNCVTCHGPHATDQPHQLKQPVNATCLSCHQPMAAAIAAATHPHAALATDAGCANCHDAHAAADKSFLKARTDKVCLTCHDKPLKTADGRNIASMKASLAAANLHGPVKSADCSACHTVHGGQQADLLRDDFPAAFYADFDVKNYALCFRCHDQQLVLKDKTVTLTNFRDGDRNLHFVHVNRAEKGRTCKTCHEVHGSDLPRHMAAAVPFEGSTWAMPIKYESATDGGRCTPGCHQSFAYSRDKKSSSTAPASRPAAPSDTAPAAPPAATPAR